MTAQNTLEPAHLLFADAAVETLEEDRTLPAKFDRMLRKSALPDTVAGKNTVIKMHLGSNSGFTTLHPVFVRTLVTAVKDSGAKSVKIIDCKDVTDGVARGYTEEVLGCPIESAFSESGKHWYREQIGFQGLDEALLSGVAIDSDCFIDLSHVKGHGDCGFGGALKNIAMGIVPNETRGKLHRLEGGITFNKDNCIFCLKCERECKNGAIIPNAETREITIFHHNCTYCQHCVMICPEHALTMGDRRFHDFSRGMAMVTAAFLKKFGPDDLFFINFLKDITIYCDCWGFSTPSLVPDIGIVAGTDIAAVDTASLDMIKTENLLPNGLPKDWRELVEGRHLFEKIHAKDPYIMVDYLTEYYPCTTSYTIEEVC